MTITSFTDEVEINPPSGTTPGLVVTQTLTGTPAGSFNANQIVVSSDNVNVGTGGSTVSGLHVLHQFGSSSAQGVRTSFQSFGRLLAATSTSQTVTAAQYVANLGVMHALAADNGTSGTPKGQIVGTMGSASTFAAATNFRSSRSVQADLFNQSTSLNDRGGVLVMDEGSTHQGTTFDYAFGVSALKLGGAGSVGWKHALLIGPMSDFDGPYLACPMSTDATLIATTGSGTITGGINWSSYTFLGNQFTGVGITIDQNGYIHSKGTATNNNAAAGYVGEIMESTLPLASRLSLTSSTGANITFIDLTAGDWDLWGNVAFFADATTTSTWFAAYLTTASATIPAPPNGGGYTDIRNAFAAGERVTLSAGMCRISVASTTRVYLGAAATFAVNSISAYGFIGARRAR